MKIRLMLLVLMVSPIFAANAAAQVTPRSGGWYPVGTEIIGFCTAPAPQPELTDDGIDDNTGWRKGPTLRYHHDETFSEFVSLRAEARPGGVPAIIYLPDLIVGASQAVMWTTDEMLHYRFVCRTYDSQHKPPLILRGPGPYRMIVTHLQWDQSYTPKDDYGTGWNIDVATKKEEIRSVEFNIVEPCKKQKILKITDLATGRTLDFTNVGLETNTLVQGSEAHAPAGATKGIEITMQNGDKFTIAPNGTLKAEIPC